LLIIGNASGRFIIMAAFARKGPGYVRDWDLAAMSDHTIEHTLTSRDGDCSTLKIAG